MVRRKISKPKEVICGNYFDNYNLSGDLDLEQDNMAIHAHEQHIFNDQVENHNHQHYCLRWNNYQTNMTSVFHQLLENEAFVDVTLACNDLSLKAHKVVLSACSTYFQKLLMENPCKHPTIIMPQDICFSDLKFIIEFVYRGEIDVSQEELQSLLRTAGQLKIKGLCELPVGNQINSTTPGVNNYACNNIKNELDSSNQIELSPVPIVSRRVYSKLRRVHSSANKRFHSTRNRLLSPKRFYKNISHIPVNSTENNCSEKEHTESSAEIKEKTTSNSVVNEDDKEKTMPATVMVSEGGKTNGEEGCEGCEGGSDTRDISGNNNNSNNNSNRNQDSSRMSEPEIQNLIKRETLDPPEMQNLIKRETLDHISEPEIKYLIKREQLDHISEPEIKYLIKRETLDHISEPEIKNLIKRETLDHISDNNGDHSCTDRDNLWSPAASSDSGSSNQPLNMTGHGLLSSQVLFPGHVELPPEPPAPSATPVPCPPQELIHNSHTVQLTHCSPATHHDLSDTSMSGHGDGMHCSGSISSYGDDVKVKFETLRSVDSAGDIDACSRMSQDSTDSLHHQSSMMITPQLLGLLPRSSDVSMTELSSRIKTTNGHNSHTYNTNPLQNHSQSHGNLSNGLNTSSSSTSGTGSGHTGGGPKTWSQEDMELALDALRNHNMSLTKASATYGIPSTTLWQRAHRLGIDTPKKEGPTKSWTEDNLNSALEALRTGTISANKASKAYGIPSSTLYKIARREGIRLAAPFNAAPTTWSPDDLERALESIRSGQTSVQRASTEFGIPTGTLYGRCKREGIELSRSNPTPWSEDAMGEALEAVRVGQMSINQAAIHYNLPYSSLYGRFKRGKYENDSPGNNSMQQDNHVIENTNSMHASDHQQLMQQYASMSQQMNTNQHSSMVVETTDTNQHQHQQQQQYTQPHSTIS